MLLDSINSVEDLRKVDSSELSTLAEEIRMYMIDVVSKNGGHLGPSLGVVELTIALHYVFNTPKDKIIWDVGHQTYAHKILTGRKDSFLSLRQYGGLSGFPKAGESEYDCYDTGHSSTSLSLALGEAVSRDLNKKHNKVIAVIGDGAMSGGLAFEALNNIGHLKKDMIIILNDNELSINKNVGALSQHLTNLISGSTYNRLTKRFYRYLKKIPRVGKFLPDMLDRARMAVKNIFVPAHFFEELGIRYFGPVDGHDIDGLLYFLNRIKGINAGPKVIHVITKKGKGYRPAEKDPVRFHGTGPFDIESGDEIKPRKLTFSSVAGKVLVEMASKDSRVVAITAAMSSGTGLDEFAKKFSSRFFDVGIAEAHAVTFSAALAKNGYRPFFAVYSSFLQRGFDQLIHDVAIMNLPAVFLIDRAGIVGEDGETHHGLFDLSYIRAIPNFTYLIPSNGEDLRDMIYFARGLASPCAIRYPRGFCGNDSVDFSKKEERNFLVPMLIKGGEELLVIATADMKDIAVRACEFMKDDGISCSVALFYSVKPVDQKSLDSLLKKYKHFITVENSFLKCGFGEIILSSVSHLSRSKFLSSFGFPDEFVAHGSNSELYKQYGLDSRSIASGVIKKLKTKK